MMGRMSRPGGTWRAALVLSALWAAGAVAAPVYTKIAYNADPSWDKVRIFLDSKSEPGFKHVEYLSNPARVQVDLEGSLDGVDPGTLQCDDSFLRSIRVESLGRSRVRVTALLAAPTRGAKVDFYRNTTQRFTHIDIERPANYQQPTWTEAELRDAHRRGVPVAVIDAGHGGYDKGAISKLRSSLHEKDVVLDVSRLVVRNLRKNRKVYPVMTRGGDCYPTLDERVDLVGSSGAGLLVSIHADSAPGNRSASGFAAWVLESGRRDVDSEARRILKYGWRSQLAKHPISKQNLVITRQARFVEEQTGVAAETLLSSIDRELSRVDPNFDNRGIKHENLKVLRHYYCPSVLLEIGFLSNLSDSRRLEKAWFREKLALAIARGIEEYYESRKRGPLHTTPLPAPPPTYIAAGANSEDSRTYSGETFEYVVKRGDNLSLLARVYNVDTDDILAASGLPSKRRIIYPGDRLRIPTRPGSTKSAQTSSLESAPTSSGPENKTASTLQNLDRIWSGAGDSSTGESQVTLADPVPSPQPQVYRVRSGDTLTSIAARFGVDERSLRRANGLRSDLIRVGQELKIPTTGVGGISASAPSGEGSLAEQVAEHSVEVVAEVTN